MMQKQSAENRIQRAHIALMRDPRFVAMTGIIMLGDFKVVEDLAEYTGDPRVPPTACTDGANCFYQRSFVDDLSDAELRFIVCHEKFHILYNHLLTWVGLYEKNPQAANMACDHVINLQMLELASKDGFLKMPTGQHEGLADPKYKGWSTKEVFDDLVKNGGGGGGGNGSGMDGHLWEKAKAMSAEQKKRLAQVIDQAIRQGKIMAGKLGGDQHRSFDELTEPKIDWRKVLLDFVVSHVKGNDASSWRKPNRRHLYKDLYLPSMISERVGSVVLAIDTSGSIGGEQISRFLSEVKGICDNVCPEVVHILYWDSAVAAHEEYRGHEVQHIVNSTKPAGGGGTSPSCITGYLASKPNIKPDVCIVLTDGYVGGDWGGQWPAPVLWCIDNGGNDKPVPGTGTALYIED